MTTERFNHDVKVFEKLNCFNIRLPNENLCNQSPTFFRVTNISTNCYACVK